MSQNPTNQSPLDSHRDEIEDLIEQGQSNVDIAKQFKCSESAVRRARSRWELEGTVATSGGVSVSGNEAEVTSAPTSDSEDLSSPEDLISERGLKPEEWTITNMVVSEWGVPGSGSRQLKLSLKRRLDITFPKAADREPGSYIKQRKETPSGMSRTSEGLVVFTGDQQAPYHDQNLHELFCEWLEDNKPERGVLIGDTVDFPDISRHRNNPEGDAKVQECINAGYNLLRDYVEASPDTEWTKLCGNHDERIRNTLIDNAIGLYGIKRAEVEDHPEASVLSVAHLMRLDELGIEFIEPKGGYAHCQVNLTPYLSARHGWLASKGSGSSALKTLEHLGYSVVVGHTHRQSLVHKTKHDIDGTPSTLAAVETGCMCQIENGLGYAVAPDWQNGFATAQVWDDGRFKLDLATYVSESLFWREQRYE